MSPFQLSLTHDVWPSTPPKNTNRVLTLSHLLGGGWQKHICFCWSHTCAESFEHCYWDISYHTPKMDSANLNIFSELARLWKTTSCFLRDIWQTDRKPRTASTSFVWLSFSVNTIAFTYHPLFELFFHRSYLKTTTNSLESFGLAIRKLLYLFVYSFIFLFNFKCLWAVQLRYTKSGTFFSLPLWLGRLITNENKKRPATLGWNERKMNIESPEIQRGGISYLNPNKEKVDVINWPTIHFSTIERKYI